MSSRPWRRCGTKISVGRRGRRDRKIPKLSHSSGVVAGLSSKRSQKGCPFLRCLWVILEIEVYRASSQELQKPSLKANEERPLFPSPKLAM